MNQTDTTIYTRRKKKNDYINNKRFYNELVAYKQKCKEAEQDEKPKPQVPNYIGEAIILLCNGLSYKHNFINYSQHWKEEMVFDAIENCVSAIKTFNSDKYNNPFAYFTMIAYNAFIRRIKEEKKETYVKHKNLEKEAIFLNDDEFTSFDFSLDSHNQIISEFESKNNVTRKKRERKNDKKYT